MVSVLSSFGVVCAVSMICYRTTELACKGLFCRMAKIILGASWADFVRGDWRVNFPVFRAVRLFRLLFIYTFRSLKCILYSSSCSVWSCDVSRETSQNGLNDIFPRFSGGFLPKCVTINGQTKCPKMPIAHALRRALCRFGHLGHLGHLQTLAQMA